MSDPNNTFDKEFADCLAQYADESGKPIHRWENVTTTLKDIDTHKLHYVKVPNNLIVIDLDIKDEDGQKSLEKNLKAANQFPKTYAETSMSGKGIHLHYIYNGGDPQELSRVYDNNIEIKVFNGNAALRRKLNHYANYPIAELSSGLPLKEEVAKVIDWDGYKNEKILRSMIIKNLNKEYHSYTKPSIDYIADLLEKAYRSGADYDVRDLEQSVFGFALGSTNKAEYCVNKVSQMHFCSDNHLDTNIETQEYNEAPIIFFDIESYPEDANGEALLIVCWKFPGPDHEVVKMINPSPSDVEQLFHYRMIGFNNREYDNHILYARANGYSVSECNKLSQNIINADKTSKFKYLFRQAYNISYTDVLDFASASHKQSLKKWEIELNFTHVEMGIPWDKSAPKERWNDIADYCANDVLATELVFNHIYSDFIAREILADLSGLTVNDKTNSHTIAILTNGIPNPKSQFVYTKLNEMKWPNGALMFPNYDFNKFGIDKKRYKPGVKIVSGKSIYKGIDPGEGGRKIGYPGCYENVALLDVISEHPHAGIKLNIFGDVITKRFEALVEARVAIKKHDYEKAIEYMKVLGKDVSKYFQGTEEEVARNVAGLADALKTSINSVYGLTSASFDNGLRDPRNEDNIVAKYGALFMINLEEEVTNRGGKVVHVSTDSMKVANATSEIVNFMIEYAAKYGFTFEFEAFFEKITLVNEAVYIAKFATEEKCMERFGYIPDDNAKVLKKSPDMLWTATGKQFAVPYVFKTLFSHEEIEFKDMCETFSVKEGALYLDYQNGLPDVLVYEAVLKKYRSAVTKLNNLKIELADPIGYAEEKKKPVRDSLEIQADIEKTKTTIKKTIGSIGNLIPLPAGTSEDDAIAKLKAAIDTGHDYRFIGKVGRFTPLNDDGAASLVCIRDDKYATTDPSGSKGTLWLEAEVVEASNMQDKVNQSYYRKLVDAAVASISQYCDFDWFVS